MTGKSNLFMNKTLKVIIIILLLYIISLCSFSGCGGMPPKEIIEKTDTIQIFDTAYIQQLPETILINKPIPKYITDVRVDTVKEETILVTENKTYKDSICTKDNDSIFVTNIIQGVNANLLSTEVELRKIDKVITNTIEVTKFVKDKKKLAIAPQLGIGYGFFNKKPDIYAGIGISYIF